MRRVLTVSLVALLAASPVWASVFSTPGGGSLKNLFTELGYGYIDVAQYQTELNLNFHGYMEVQLLQKDGLFARHGSFGVAYWEKSRDPDGITLRHKELFGPGEGGPSEVERIDFDTETQVGLFFDPNLSGPHRRFYTWSGLNPRGSIQSLIYQDPFHENIFYVAWEDMNAGLRVSDRDYDDAIMKVTVYPAPEPATWLLLSVALLGGAVAGLVRRRLIAS